METDRRKRLFDFFAAESKKFVGHVRSRFRDISEMDAEDIVGEVMLGVAMRADTSLPVENLAAYVYRALSNKAIDYRRRDQRVFSLDGPAEQGSEFRLMDMLCDSAPDVCGEAERKEYLRSLKQAIGKLEPKARAVFIATEVMGKTFKELSEEWHEPAGTLLSRKCRAVKALREMLKDIKN